MPKKDNSGPQATKFAKSAPMLIPRAEIKNAPYNPRKISDKALAALRKNIRERGLMGGLVWNKRTGHLVSGHQRLKALDALEKTEDYLVPVEVVDLDLKAEKEQNVFMNSPTVQGQFDEPLLREMLSSGGIDYQAAGLDMYDLNMLGVADLYAEASEAQQNLAEKLDAVKEVANTDTLGQDEGEDDYEERKQATKDLKKKIAEGIKDDVNPDSYVIVSFDNFANKKAFMERFGFAEDDKYIKGEIFSQMIERTK